MTTATRRERASSGLRRCRVGATLALLLSATFCGNLHAAIVSVKAVSQADQAGTNVPVTFGQVFKNGDIHANQTLRASINGQRVPLQVDKKATNPNGSLRQAVLTALVPRLGAHATKTIKLSSSGTGPSGKSVTLNDLLATDFNAKIRVRLAWHHLLYTADARQMLTHAQTHHTCKPWGKTCAVWLSGPLVGEWHVSAPLKSTSGAPHPRLSARFYVRYYPRTQQIRTSVIVENDHALRKRPKDVKYTVKIFINGRQRYSRQNLLHSNHTRWCAVFWTESPHVRVAHDLKYLESTGAIPNYDPHLKVPAKAITQLYKSFKHSNHAPMHTAIVHKNMKAYAGRPDIGPLPRWTVLRLLTMDPRLIKVNKKIGILSGSWPIHLRDRGTGRPISLEDYPHLSTHPKLIGSKRNPYPRQPRYGNRYGLVPDWNHEPSLAYIPYLLTGDYYYLEELQFWAAWNPLRTDPAYRGYAKGLFKWTQVRGQAWGMRTLGRTAYITPDDDPMKGYWKRQLRHNLDWYNAHYADNQQANELGFLVHNVSYNNHRAIAPWQDDFFTWTMGALVRLGFDNAHPMLKYKAKFPVGRMTAPGYCWIMGSIYTLNVRNHRHSPFYRSFAKAYKHSVSSKLRNTRCASKAMAKLLGPNYKAGDMVGYPWSPQGYPANMQPALAVAAGSGIENAHHAWQVFTHRRRKPDYSSYPNWDIVPR